MMTSRRVHVAVCWVYIVSLVVQFLLAGIGVMGGDIDLHMAFGGLVLHLLIPFLLIVTAAIGRMGWAQVGWSFGLFVLLTLQIAMVGIGGDMDNNVVQGLHPALALLSWPYVYFMVLAPARAMVGHGDVSRQRVRA
ncbi:MAG: hypothetical protein JWM25_505 [Thermoleophilia bacterium]|nr:hypothetical protein [Thermoleophilia bacterium]MCZ4495922.1 hypothetical protein [Thermoleophilia bacterium]